jgi:hypothetical protein
VGLGETAELAPTVVLASIVDKNYFVGIDQIVEHFVDALDQLCEHLLTVIDGDNDTDDWG